MMDENIAHNLVIYAWVAINIASIFSWVPLLGMMTIGVRVLWEYKQFTQVNYQTLILIVSPFLLSSWIGRIVLISITNLILFDGIYGQKCFIKLIPKEEN